MRSTYARVNLGAIAHNYQLACKSAPASKAIAVIKANAYGHGMVRVARKLESAVPAFAVAMIEEAVALREAGIQKPVLILQGVQDPEDLGLAAKHGFWLMLHHRRQVEAVISAKLGNPLTAWLKLDTGMHRLGLPGEGFAQLYADLLASGNIQADPVICTHLACADELGGSFTDRQLEAMSLNAPAGAPLSIANSAGILYWPQSHAAWNRPGIMLYGSCPTGAYEAVSTDLKPAMTMCSEIISIRKIDAGEGVGYGLDWVAKRPSVIGTVAIGYGDGYPRHAPSGTPVLVKGQRAPLAGRVSMDAISVDLTDLGKVNVGDAVELWGENLGVNEVASMVGTISYEILAGLTGRVPLRYTG